MRLGIETGYPWSGRVTWPSSRRPRDRGRSRCGSRRGRTARRSADGDRGASPVEAGSPWVSGQRAWRTGETIVLDLADRPRVIAPDPRIDAVRGCVALERGPLVYCIETADLPDGVDLEDVYLVAGADAVGRGAAGPWRCCRRAERAGGPSAARQSIVALRRAGARRAGAVDSVTIRAIPYYAWANRSVRAMRVWIPEEPVEPSGRAPGSRSLRLRGGRMRRRRRLAHDEASARRPCAAARATAVGSRPRSIASSTPSPTISPIGIRNVVSAGNGVRGQEQVVEADDRQLVRARSGRRCRRRAARRRRRGRSSDATAVGGSGRASSARSASSPPASVFGDDLDVPVGEPAEALRA